LNEIRNPPTVEKTAQCILRMEELKLLSGSYVTFWEDLPREEQVLVDFLRHLVIKTLPGYCQEKISNGVPYFFGKKRICLIWPASIKGGGVKQGVLFGFSYGCLLDDPEGYLDHGTNKRIYYKIYKSLEEIDPIALTRLLHKAVILDSL